MPKPFIIKSADRIHSTSDDFILKLRSPLKATKLTLAHFHCPNLMYTINETNDAIDVYYIKGLDEPNLFSLPHGVYDLDSLCAAVVNAFNAQFGMTITCTLSIR